MRFILPALLALVLSAEDKKPAPAPAKLTEVQALRLENAAMRLALLQKDYDALSAEQNALVSEICKGAGIDAKDCSIDPRSKTVARKPEPAKAKAKAKAAPMPTEVKNK